VNLKGPPRSQTSVTSMPAIIDAKLVCVASLFFGFFLWFLFLSADTQDSLRSMVSMSLAISAAVLAFVWQNASAKRQIKLQEKSGREAYSLRRERLLLIVRSILVSIGIFLFLLILALPLGRF
ncbi:MAG: hypothetical protein ACK6A7_23010, partial [Planctomycetota bacterium]